jgi:energy-coupling factor transporter ATP-binding protein EcfA2
MLYRSGKDIYHNERLRLIQTINRLPNAQFEELVFALNPPSGLIPSSMAAQASRSTALLEWVESEYGIGLNHCKELLFDVLGLATEASYGQCPYKGLSYFDFNDDDYKYFYGRELLINKLLDKVRKSSFIAIVGASGSGKSSVLRAGLLQQLKQDNRYEIRLLTPEEHPLQNLAQAFVDTARPQVERAIQQQQVEKLLEDGSNGLRRLVQNSDAEHVFLVIDQFEESFTLCTDILRRQQFFETILSALDETSDHLSVLVAMRSDFVGRCFENSYSGLADKVQNNLVAVLPMEYAELKEAIIGPAFSIGINIEPELVQTLLNDIEKSPGNLPLLQYTLRELWTHQENNTLKLKTYIQLGGITGTLQQRADAVYETLNAEQKVIAQHIFLSLTQPGDNVEDTRRRVAKHDLVTARHAETAISEVIQTLSDANLIVTSEEISPIDASRLAVVDVAHEALIRHWKQLQEWLEKSRDLLVKQRRVENDAKEWSQHGKSRSYLLKGIKLVEAKQLFKDSKQPVELSSQAQDFVAKSQINSRLGQIAALSAVAGLSALTVFSQQQFSERRFQEQYTAVLVGGEIIPETPNVLRRALAIADRQTKENDVGAAVESYKAVLIAANRFFNELETGRILFSGTDVDNVSMAAKNAEDNIANLISKNYIPELINDLSSPLFGELKVQSLVTDYEDQFTEGALRTTYEILMRKPGIGSDMNDDGYLNATEAFLLPCATLKEIEQLWREATEQQCGFHDDGDFFIAEGCNTLSNYTLTERIFPNPFKSFEERAKVCKI